MLASEVLKSVRSLIGDRTGAKWEPSDLLDALNNARTELIRHTALLKASGKLFIVADQTVYDLPSDCFYLTRATTEGTKVVTKSRDQLDSLDADWPLNTSETDLELLVKDRLNQRQIESYPILTDPTSPYEIVGTVGPITEIQGVTLEGGSFGGITDIVDTEVSNPIITREDAYGVLTDIEDKFITVNIFYLKEPGPLTAETDDTGVASNYKMYLVKATAGELLMYDTNVENMNKGTFLQGEATAMLPGIKADNQADYIVDTEVSFRYKGPFDE